MKASLKPILIFLGALGIVGGIVMVSGAAPIGASSGHWPITEKILSFAMERSMNTYALFVDSPPEFDRRMVLRGAGHFEFQCRFCHGATEEGHFQGQLTTPRSPFLPPEMDQWSDKELFRILKHGVKFTGMPAWGDLKRDDEVWSMVAFLRELPKLNRESYQSLVTGDMPPPEPGSLRNCQNCHGIDGNGREGAFPKLSGQNEEYLAQSLRSYREGGRHSGTMEMLAHGLTDRMIREIAQFYSSKKRRRDQSGPAPTEVIRRGEKIAKFGIPEERVGACVRCHGPREDGKPIRKEYPNLAGQPPEYLVNQLRLFEKNIRGGKNVEVMKKAVPKLSPSDREAVAAYFENLLEE